MHDDPPRKRTRAGESWDVSALDLDAYLRRIGHDGPRTATADVLRALHRAHMSTMRFTNLDLFMGSAVRLDVPTLQNKLVHRRRGGYCLEQNMLFAAALERLGFTVRRYLSRIRRGDDAVRARGHAVLLVDVDGERLLCDAGFGDEGLIEPIPLTDRATLTVGEWTWRVGLDEDEWVLRSQRPDGWFDVFGLRLERHHPVDFDTSNHFMSSHPRSAFVGQLIAQRGDEHLRHSLQNLKLTTQYPDGRREHRLLATGDVGPVLGDVFGLTVTAHEEPLLQAALVEAAALERRKAAARRPQAPAPQDRPDAPAAARRPATL
ncbi:arylamine N-acetyltransferase family protein [Streptomyces luteolus]|uniref:Arylamine N-acetyltransferase n=1 Tax=Streptomyces luteolus TaxID=3043615 RepID=A0ABT6T4S6_9ACTN|nr:arylamine N-acetyltransferase [Streptomyces sp. B-S-A12]MDI3422868.1 arylamine N-acetyltransferase [Streptomyces sp. B-S-A12]